MLVVAGLFAQLLLAQALIKPTLLTQRDGLSQGYVSALLQDQEGFLWVGTKNGLDVYNGNTFEHYISTNEGSECLAGEWIADLLEIKDYLFVTTNSNTLFLIHKPSWHCTAISLAPFLAHPESDALTHMWYDGSKHIWLNTFKNLRLLRITVPEEWPDLTATESDWLAELEVRSVLEHGYWLTRIDEQHLLVGHADNYKLFNTDELTLSPLAKDSPWQDLGSEVTLLYQADLIKDKYRIILETPEGWKTFQTEFPIQYAFYLPTSQQIWIQKGETYDLFRFSLADAEDKAILRPSDAEIKLDLAGKGIIKAIVDQWGVLWLGTNGYGLQKVSPRRLAIESYLPGTTIYDYPYPFAGGEVLINLLQNRLFYIPGRTAKMQEIVDFLSPIPKGPLFKIQYQASDQFWILKWDTSIDAQTNGIRPTALDLYLTKRGKPALLKSYKILDPSKAIRYAMALDQYEEQLLIILSNQWIIRNINTGEEQEYFCPFPFAITHRSQFYNLTQTGDGHWWLGTNTGLIRAWMENNELQFKLYTQENSDLTNNDCASLLVDPNNDNLLWIGTKGGGLYQFDIQSEQWKTIDNLPDQVIYGVLADSVSNLWMSSNKGIFCYEPGTEQLRSFSWEDGLQDNEFNTFAYGQAPDGKMYFGGINGLNAFYPSQLAVSTHEPQARIVSLSVNNQKIVPGDSSHILTQKIAFTDKIILSHDQSNLNFGFAALDFTAPKRTRYRYYIEGIEQVWEHETTDPRATYLNLPPGKHTLWLSVTNPAGIWSSHTDMLQIVILSPWYQRWWAYVFYGLFFLLLIRWYLSNQRRRLALQHSVAMEQQEADRLREAEIFRTQLYTNITHELRTPLTVMLGTAEQLQSSTAAEQTHKLGLLQRSGKNLLHLVNQLLDVAKAKYNPLSVNMVHGDIVGYVHLVLESFQTIATQQNIQLEIYSPNEAIYMDYDSEKIQYILTNLIGNALKFTPDSGKVTVTITRRESATLELTVTDTGKGIPTAALPFIFDRFYQTEHHPSLSGSGIGLAFTKELVDLLSGTIEVNSEINKGTSFIVRLPIVSQETVAQEPAKIEAASKAVEEENLLQEDSTKDRILIIEDNEDVVAFLKTCFPEQYAITFAFDAEAGIQLATEYIPDLIISDVMMPGRSGFELCAQLKTDERTSHIPIILLTAKADLTSRLTGFEQGANAYVTKPFNQAELLLQVNNLLQLRQQWQLRYQSLETLSPSASDPATAQEDGFILKVKEIVEEHLSDEAFDVPTLCREVGVSRTQLHHKLKALTGRSTSHFVRLLRLNHAKALLRASDQTISEVAYTVGFSSRAYFSRAFSAEFGISPKVFREDR